MKRLILTSILTLISAFAFAAAVTVNGNSCGSLKSVAVNPTGDLTVTTDATCGVVSPPVEPPPVVTPPSTCPAGVVCVDRPWPSIKQEVFALRQDQSLAIRVKTTAEGISGRLVTNYTVGDTGSRQVALSATAGDFSGSTACVKSGLEATSTQWQQGGTGWRCVIPANSTYYVNVRFTNCEAGRTCRFTLSGG